MKILSLSHRIITSLYCIILILVCDKIEKIVLIYSIPMYSLPHVHHMCMYKKMVI